jgi:hypothetical protein
VKYLVKARQGRRVDAIGIMHPIQTIVEADNPDAALRKAYEKIDHLLGVSVEPEGSWSIDGAADLID